MKHVNQKTEIKDGEKYCGAATVAMLTEEIPQDVADVLGHTTPDDKLTSYLENFGFTILKKPIASGGDKKSGWAFTPKKSDFDAMRKALDEGFFILYHFAGWDGKSSGHYALCYGHNTDGFVFNDPAGNRVKGYFGDGEEVVYSEKQLTAAGMKALWGVK